MLDHGGDFLADHIQIADLRDASCGLPRFCITQDMGQESGIVDQTHQDRIRLRGFFVAEQHVTDPSLDFFFLGAVEHGIAPGLEDPEEIGFLFLEDAAVDQRAQGRCFDLVRGQCQPRDPDTELQWFLFGLDGLTPAIEKVFAGIGPVGNVESSVLVLQPAQECEVQKDGSGQCMAIADIIDRQNPARVVVECEEHQIFCQSQHARNLHRIGGEVHRRGRLTDGVAQIEGSRFRTVVDIGVTLAFRREHGAFIFIIRIPAIALAGAIVGDVKGATRRIRAILAER